MKTKSQKNVDGIKRDYPDDAKRRYYSQRRAERFARHMFSVTKAGAVK